MSPVRDLQRGSSTAVGINPVYRVGRIAHLVTGRWLDYGCADGGYGAELLAAGAAEVVGVDVEADRVADAQARGMANGSFVHWTEPTLPFESGSFDGAFANEVMEHVQDECTSLGELFRVVRPGGTAVVISPNRWFPFEGHTVNIGTRSISPAPLIPWLPKRLTRSWVEARNYWPHELAGHVARAGFDVVDTGFIWPVLDVYRWLPPRLIRAYQARITTFDRMPGLRRFGISTLVIGRKPA